MRKPNKLRRQFTRQFYRGNGIYLFLGLMQTIALVAAQLFLSWLMQQLIDTATGTSSEFSLLQIGGFAILGLGLWILTAALEYVSKPKFISKAMRQYKNHVFEELSKKSISLFQARTLPYIFPH